MVEFTIWERSNVLVFFLYGQSGNGVFLNETSTIINITYIHESLYFVTTPACYNFLLINTVFIKDNMLG